MSAATLTLPAFAKINLHLHVLGKRPDGFHEIDTLLQTISLHDTLTIAITESSEIVLSCDDPSLPVGSDNLVYRAARALQDCLKVARGAHIRLTKRIPAQAGLGGGSADAAVTLMALAHLWETNYTRGFLQRIAETLGADVPFFLFGGTARGTGTGSEILAVADASEKFLLIVKPNSNIATVDAYSALQAPSLTNALTSADAKTILSSSERGLVSDPNKSKALQNDFEPVVSRLAPEIGRVRVALLRAGASAALLAGSGSAVFGFFDNRDGPEQAIQSIELEAGWRVFPCRTVGRDSYRSALGAAGEILAGFN
jgi:4-diphosphocytidyl-2-C-methyl-D-erythritol kinase